MQDSRGCVKKDTLIVVDPTDVCKENARKMQYLYKVRDGSRSKENGEPLLVNGYASCMAIDCDSGNRRIAPLHFSPWSTIAPDYRSENAQGPVPIGRSQLSSEIFGRLQSGTLSSHYNKLCDSHPKRLLPILTFREK